MPLHPSRRRAGFTLVELLVVILIISVLVGLITAAAFSALKKGPEVQTRNDMTQLANAIAQFKAEFKVNYLPSRFYLSTSPGDYTNGTGDLELKRDSLAFLQSMFPTMKASIGSTPNVWLWTDAPLQNDAEKTLEGDQCLVFFLGGMQRGWSSGVAATIGYSNRPSQPYADNDSRIPAFYNFPIDRLKRVRGKMPSYIDPYGTTPYAYYSVTKSGSYDTIRNHCLNLGKLTTPNGLTGNAFLEFYSTNISKFANANTYQIISAGPDGIFGDGGRAWAGCKGGVAASSYGQDDFSNFSGTRLGVQE